MQLGVWIVIAMTLAMILVYAVFDPIAGACESAKNNCPSYVNMTLTILLVGSGVVTLFGTLAAPGGQSSDGSYREQRIRLSIAMSVFVIYIIYFGMAVFWYEETPEILETLTDLLKVIVPFYFGSSAVAQVWGNDRLKSNGED